MAGYTPTCVPTSSSIHQNRHVWAHAETRAPTTYPSEQTCLSTRRLVPTPIPSIRTDTSGYTPTSALSTIHQKRHVCPFPYQSEQTSLGTFIFPIVIIYCITRRRNM
ncbi:hypothetical protein DPMN_058787 [Dreissena polymorpha]|uniref:Uncharacterized protein n=1 Tax=Dreissena polymorpha TaxID=45954 RepID=A0A9D4C2Q4_DREPO|nr:hypothetical protein DPMN_058787 [Dreissena polymorpha]